MVRWQRLPLIVALPFTLVSCAFVSNGGADNRIELPVPSAMPAIATVAPSAAVAAVPPASCPITQPTTPLFIPPSPYPPAPPSLYAGEFWSGTAMLWTMVRVDGTWRALPYHNGTYTQKIFWWRQGYDYRTEPEPNLTVTGRRLDAPAPPLGASRATNGFRDDIGSFMVVGVDIPSPGCWEITGDSAGTVLRFVVWVAP